MRFALLLLVMTAVLVFPSGGAAAIPQDKATLKVLIKPIEPFVFERDGKPVGYSIDLWDRIAKECNFQFEYKNLTTVGEVIDGLKNKAGDVGIAAISLTQQREQIVDFSHGFYTSGLQILVPTQVESGSPITAMLKSLVNTSFLMLMGGLLALLILITHLLWFFERKNNPESFPDSYGKGIWESLWWTLCTVISGGCENKAPLGVAGRVVALVWMLAGVLLLSYVTASVTTAMTVNQLSGDINGPDDLAGKPVATVKDSTAEKYLQERKARVLPFATIKEAIAAMSAKDAKAVVYDAPVLQYHVARSGGKTEKVVGPLFRKQDYGIGLQQGSPHRKTINEALLKLREQGFFDELQMKWFGTSD